MFRYFLLQLDFKLLRDSLVFGKGLGSVGVRILFLTRVLLNQPKEKISFCMKQCLKSSFQADKKSVSEIGPFSYVFRCFLEDPES